MRGKSMILIVVALGCGLVASIGISQILDSKGGSGTPEVETKKVYVAVRNIDLKERLTKEMVALEEWPIDKVAEDAVSDFEQLKDMAAGQRLFAGEPIRMEKLQDPTQGKSIRIPKGYRVQAIKVKSEDIVGNIVEPGDHVDVLVYLKKSGTITQTSARTILSDVRVFAINSQTHLDTDSSGQTIKANTVSLLVKPDQVETLLLASRMGQISLSLRSPDDDTQGEIGEGKTPDEIVRGAVEDATPAPVEAKPTPVVAVAPEREAKPDFKSWITAMTAGAAQKQAEAQDDNMWSVAVITPEGITNYQVDKGEGYHSPQKVNPASAATYASPARSAAPTLFAPTVGTSDSGPADTDVIIGDPADSDDGDDGASDQSDATDESDSNPED